jgi:hypothetical protein
MLDPVDAVLSGSLGLHVTRLAEANQVFSPIRIFGGRKLTKRFDVVNRKTFADALAAMSTVAKLLGDHLRANFKPSLAAISRNAPNVAGRIRPVEYARSFKAFSTAEACRAILTGKPRLLTECFPAMFAGSGNALSPRRMVRSRHLFRKGIRGSKASAQFVADHVSLGADIQCLASAKPSATLKRAKAGFRSAVRLNRVFNSAFFADEIYRHSPIVAGICFGSMGSGTTGVAAMQEGFEFIGIELEPKYVAIAERRIASATDKGLFA